MDKGLWVRWFWIVFILVVVCFCMKCVFYRVDLRIFFFLSLFEFMDSFWMLRFLKLVLIYCSKFMYIYFLILVWMIIMLIELVFIFGWVGMYEFNRKFVYKLFRVLLVLNLFWCILGSLMYFVIDSLEIMLDLFF